MLKVERVSASTAKARRELHQHPDLRSSCGGKHREADITNQREHDKSKGCSNELPSSETRPGQCFGGLVSNRVSYAQTTRGAARAGECLEGHAHVGGEGKDVLELEESRTKTSEGVLATGDGQDVVVLRGGKRKSANPSETSRDIDAASDTRMAGLLDDDPTPPEEGHTQNLAPSDIRLMSTLSGAECKCRQIHDAKASAAAEIAKSEPGIGEQAMSSPSPSATGSSHGLVKVRGVHCSCPPADPYRSSECVSSIAVVADESQAEVPRPPSIALGATIPLDAAR